MSGSVLIFGRSAHFTLPLKTRSPVEILDLRPALLAAKPSNLLYHRYDSHWNDRGALVAARQIAKRLRDWFPAVPVLEREDFDEVPGVPSGDSTSMLGLVDSGKLAMPGLVLRGGWKHRVLEPLTPSPYSEDGRVASPTIPASNLPRLLMFFASRLVPYISEDFSHAVYLWRNDFDTWEVEQARPDVVIQEFVARHLITHVPNPQSPIPNPQSPIPNPQSPIPNPRSLSRSLFSTWSPKPEARSPGRIPLNRNLNVPCGCARHAISGPKSTTRPLPSGASTTWTAWSRSC